ncbi:MAG: V-type ATP synthase subunit I [Planctomycetota bacterium]
MAIASMQKVVIVAHRSQTVELLEALQTSGLVQILDSDRAMVSKEWPELMVEGKRHRDIEDSLDRLKAALGFIAPYAPKGTTSLFAPLAEVGAAKCAQVVSGDKTMAALEQIEDVQKQIDQLTEESDALQTLLEQLKPWSSLSIDVQEFNTLSSSTTFVGQILIQQMELVTEKLAELGAVIETVASTEKMNACVIVSLNETAGDVHKALRSVEFEAAAFEGLAGTVAENIAKTESRLDTIGTERTTLTDRMTELAKNQLDLQILSDHNKNLLERAGTESSAPSTDHACFLEGWVQKRDYKKLEKIVSKFDAADLSMMEPAEGEEPPIEIVNNAATRPFETITRLYGTPSIKDVDPTVFLAPFFALFFGLCLTDAGYGIVLTLLLAWALKKMQGDKKALVMLLICSVLTIAAGAITGGWFADTVQTLLPQEEGSFGATLESLRQKMMLFDPMAQPLVFIGLSLGLGYVQILFGLIIGFFNHLKRKEYAAAVYEKLTWVILLNCLLLFALAKNGILPAVLGTPFAIIALVMVGLIFWCTERNSGIAGRIGGGVFAVFSTVFYVGDMLSYVRIMALGMVTAGLGMAVNILTKLVMDVPYVGFILGLLLFVFGHFVNIALSLLSAFVHSLRLQFVEFFPKFFEGGGREFKPLRNDYKYVTIVENDK